MESQPSFLKNTFNVFFWLFNTILLLVIYVGILPFLGVGLFTDAINGQVPLNFFLACVGLVGVPTTCSIAGRLPQNSEVSKRSISLFQLFYLLEAPLLTVCLLRFFWFRDLTPATSILLCAGIVGTLVCAHQLLQAKNPGKVTSGWHLAGHTLMLTLSLYLSLLAAFYILPVTVLVIFYAPLVVIYAVILLPIAILLAGFGSLPFGMTIAYFRAWLLSCKQLAARYGVWRMRALIITTLAVEIGLVMMIFQQQPQIEAFCLLQNPPTTAQERQALLEKSDVIRRGLINAYLSRYRYPQINDTEIRNMYEDILNFPKEAAQNIQDIYNILISPFQYNGAYKDVEKARTIYAQFFDTPIIRQEKAAIQKAIQSTFNRSEVKAGLDDINKERVWLEEQLLTVKPQGDSAEVEIYEIYNNKTFNQEEILYYFSLPESAAITGVWLGETGDRNRRYVFDVAPRGAAQQVYNQEVQRRVDPALLEQVGPRTYRLRAFPIPRQGQGKMHLWMTYKVLKQDAGWLLPQLHERRNLYWTNKTKRVINGKTVAAQDQWLPSAIPASKSQPQSHEVTLGWGGRVIATPFSSSAYRLPEGQRFAVILDGSYSMNAHRQEVTQTFNWLKDNILKRNKVDLYLTTATPAQPKRVEGLQNFDPKDAVFYGSLQPREMLSQFLQLRGNTTYDAVLVVTDPGSYELTEDKTSVLSVTAPLWMLHLGGLQFAYDDATLQAIQNSGGGVSTEIQELMQRLGTHPTWGEGTSLLSLVDGYAWFLGKPSEQLTANDLAFAPLAARQWITQLNESVQPGKLNQLDTIHAIAEKYGIVTPYSSMIVLVNDQQRQDLKRAEQKSDRFKREVEDQQLPQPATKISAVPEPAEWMLLGIVLIMLMFISSQSHLGKSFRSLTGITPSTYRKS